MIFFLVIIFLALIGIPVKYLLDERKQGTTNKGVRIVVLLVMALELLCIVYFCVQSVEGAWRILPVYYLIHAWLLPAILYMFVSIERSSLNDKKTNNGMKPVIAVSALQSLSAVAGLFWDEIFVFEDKLMGRRTWLVAVNPDNAGYLPDYGAYIILMYIGVLFVCVALIRFMINGPKLYRSRYIVFFAIAAYYALIGTFAFCAALPVWIQTVFYNAIWPVGIMMSGDYSKKRIREWSLDHFADNMSDGLLLYDRDDNQIHVNAMIRRSIHAELLRQFTDRSKLDEWLNTATEMDGSRTLKYEGPDRVYYFRSYVQELTDNDIKIGTLYILHDHSDSYNRIMAMRRSNEELEKAGRMKSDFLANMSHEIRTPMNAVIGMAELAMRDGDPDRVNDYLRQIQSSGKNLLNIINDILDYSKIESGKMEIIEDKYSPAEELSDIANVLFTRIGNKPVELYVIVDGPLPHTLVGDAMRIRQILINLANNAIKFTNEGMVKILVSSRKLNDDHIEFTFHVIDTGIGIKEEDKNKLFESFQQVDSKRNRSVEGTGLGLAISKRLVSAMGGSIGIESEYGKGSDFWFTVPQRVVDDNDDLMVENAGDKYVSLLPQDTHKTDEFMEEMRLRGVHGGVLASYREYSPSDGIDFVLFDLKLLDDQICDFLEAHPDVRGIVFADPGVDLTEDIPNLHIMRRPQTTMNLVRMLNERYDESICSDRKSLYEVDFCAPDAKVLVVDDNDLNLTIAGGLLESMDIVPDYAHGGREAVEMAVSNDYDIIFMDHMMPEVDGVEATMAIRKELNSMIHPVIIALSANVMEEARKLFKSSGMNDFVGKPIDVKDLAEKVRKWLPDEKIKPKTPGNETGDTGTKSSMSDLDILDTEAAIAALGSPMLYDKILGEYYRSGNDKYEGIKQAYINEDWADYTIRVHALKSSSRQIGAMTLGDMAEELEKAGKASDIDTIRQKTDDTLKEYDRILDALRERYDTSADAGDDEKSLIDQDTLRGLTDELSGACEELDMDRMEAVSEKLRKYSYADDLAQLIDDLIKAIGMMDTEKCEELIGIIANKAGL